MKPSILWRSNMNNTINLNDYLANLSDDKLSKIYEDLVEADMQDIKLNFKEEIGYFSKDFVFNELDARGLAVYSDELED